MENNTLPSSFLPTEILPDYSTTYVVNATQYGAGDVGGAIAPTAITGREAARIQLDRLGYKLGETFHAKLNNNIIFEATVTKPGFFSIREQEKLLASGPDEKCKEGTWINTVENKKTGVITYEICKEGTTAPFWINKGNSIYSDGWKYLEERAEVGTGLFIIPNHTQGGIGADYATDFSNLFVEIDDRPIPEQWEKINEIQSQYGLTPSLIVGSGGKSLHVYYKLATSPDAETWKVLQKKLILLFQSDPAIINLNREMRFAGFTRKAKGTQQSVEFDSEATYTVEDFEARLSSAYPHGLSEGRWDEARPVLKSEAFKSDGDRDAEIKRILSLPEESLAKNIKKARKSQTTTGLNYVGEGSLVDAVKYNGGKVEGSLSHAVNTWKVQGGKDLFNWPGHNWDGSGRRGCCPWHESTTGTSFWLSELENGTVLAHCPTCTDNKGIDALRYQYKLQHGVDAEPTGKDWFDFAKEMTGWVDAPATKDDWKERYERERREKAVYRFTRKPDVVVKEGYLPSIARCELPKGIIALKGDWGVGKTFFISNFLKGYDGKVLQVAHLNGLLDNTAPKFGLIHHKDVKASGDYDALHNRFSSPDLAITIDSLGNQLKPDEWAWGRNFALILDEVEQALEYACKSSNVSSNRQQVRAKLEWLIKNAEYLILSDRDLSNEALTYIEQVRGDSKKSYIIQHTGEKGLGRKIQINTNKKKDVVLTHTLEDIKKGKKIAIPFENKADLLAYEDMLRAAEIPDSAWFSAHGDNSNEEEIRKIIKDIDKEYTNYQVLLYTMTLGTAISLETEHFDKVYGFFTGDAFDAWKQSQMLFRYRLNCEIEIWVSPKKRTFEIKEENLLKDLVTSLEGTEALQANFNKIKELAEFGLFPSVSGKIGEEDLHWINLSNAYTARTNASMANPSQTLCDALEGAGFELEIEQSDEAIATVEGEEHKTIKKENRDKDDLAVASAELLTDTALAEKLKQTGSLTKKERNQIKKTLLHKETGLEVDQELVKKDRTKNFVSSVKMLMLVMGNEEDAVAADLIEAENRMHSDRKFYQARRKLFIDLGAVELVDFLVKGGAYASKGVECEIVKTVARNIRKSKREIKRLLSYTINTEKITKNAQGDDLVTELHEYKVSDAKLVGELLSKLGIKLARKQNRDTLHGVVGIYSLDPKNWEEITKVINHQQTLKNTVKWDVFLEQKKAQFLAAETQAQQGLNPVTHPTSIPYIKRQGCVTAKQASGSKESLDPTDAMMARISASESKPASPQPNDTGLRAKALARIAAIKARFQPEIDFNLAVGF